MSKRIQCIDCENAEYGEDLYEYDGDILCRYCIVSKVCETSIPCEYYGECNDTRKKTEKCNCAKKDKRIAELEKELASQNSNEVVKKKYDSLKEAIKFLWEKQITDEHIFYVIDQLGQQHIDRIQDIENGICKIERLEKELAELKENSIVPKFKVGNKVWFIVDGKIEKGKILENSKHKLCRFVYSITGGGIGYYSENYIFATEQEAQQKLKELEEK